MNNNNFCILSDKFQRVTDKNSVGNTNVLTISAQHGLINQFEYYNHQYASENTSGYTLLHKGEFAYNKSYSDGYPWGATKRLEHYDSGAVSPLYICFSAKDGVCADFYSYYFESEPFYRKIYKIAQEGARNHGLLNVSTEDFFKIQIANPPLEEQRRIAEILGCCDRVITLKKELIAEKKKQKKALMQKLLNPDSGFRLPGFSGKWKSCNLGCFGECIRGVSYQPSEDLRNNYSSETYTLLRANNFGQSELNMSEVFFVDKKCVSSEQEIISGDILISMSSGSKKAVGKITLITNIAPKTCVGAFCAIFRSKNSNFLKHFFETRDYQQQLSLLLEGTNINNLTPQEIENLKVNIPDNLKEQQAIADILSAADKEIDLLEQELIQQEQKKKSLMQLLLTGIVRV